jgi:hypothetical protein
MREFGAVVPEQQEGERESAELEPGAEWIRPLQRARLAIT